MNFNKILRDEIVYRNINIKEFNNKTHEGNSYNKVQQNFLPELYQKVQDKIKAEYEEKKIPYVVLYWSESDVFPTENKIYPLNEFNDLILQADKEFYNRKQYAEKKYGSVENYWYLESENKVPEEDKGITFGYDKTRFKICNIPNPKNPEDTLSYEPSSYDIGDGNGSIFDDVRSTCSYDEVIEALNRVEINLYYSKVSDFQKKAVEKVIEAEKFVLKENLKENTKSLDKAQNEYKELHKKWLMDSSEVEKVDTNLNNATEAIKNTYDTSIKNVLSQIIDEYPLAVKDNPDFLKYTVNETKKMIISELYSPSRNAQKAMNDNKNIYENFDWKKLHLIWEQFPVNVNKTEYIEQKLEEVCKEKGIELNENVVSTTTLEPNQEEISNARKLVIDTQAEIAKKKYESEQGSNYDSNLSTTDIAKKLRDYVKKNYPDYKFSITSKYFSGGSEINVTLKQAPGEITNENIMKEYFEHNSAKEWWNNDTGKYEKYYEMTDEKKKEVVKYSVDRAYVFNIPSTEENPSWMSPEVNKVMMDVRRQLESYNFDHSDSQSDYYDVNFWSHYDISKEAVERSIKITRAPEKSTELTPKDIGFNNEEFEQENVIGKESSFRYKLLSRMQQDCEYYLGNGNRNPKHLWALEEVEHIKNMISLYNSFSFEDKPEWLTIEQLDNFSKELTGKSLEEHGWMDTINENNVFQELSLGKNNADSYTNEILDKIRATGIEVVTDKDEFDRILETEDILQKMTNDEIIKNIAKQRDDAIEEKNRINAKKLKNFKSEVTNSNEIESKIQIQNVNITDNEKEILSVALKETAEEFISVVYSRENYNKIFGDGVIESPIETIKLGSNQFVKLSPGNRNNFMYAIRQTLENPSIILGKETWDNNSETFKPVHLYGKSFVNYNNSEKLVESLIIFKEGNNIAVSLHPNGIDKFVEQIKTTNDIVYLDDEVSRVAAFAITDGDSHVVKENENFLSRVRQVSYSSLGQESYPLINKNYNRDSLLSSEEFISSKGIETGKLEITKDNFDRYFNILNQHDAFKDKRNKIASELFNFHVSSENKDEIKKWLEEQGYTITEKEVTQYMKNDNGLTYGFVHNGKIYLNSELMNSNAAVHEYTHLWDAYTQKTNPELWNKGLALFKDTKYWNEVISDPNYQNIKDDENLVLSEIHSRICGDIAEKVLDRIAELDGEQVKLDAIDWNKEIYFYIREEFELDEKYKSLNFTAMNTTVFLTEFLSTPMKDLMASKNINVSKELSWEELASLFQKQDSSTLGDFKTTKETVQKEESFETEKEYKDEVVLRRLDDILDFHAYNNDGTDVIDASGNTYTDKVLEEKYLILEQISTGIVDGKITSLDNAQILLNDKLLNSELYKEVSKKLKKEMQQEFNFNDPGVNQEVISAAEKERDRILEPVLNGERTGMYKAFKEFEEKGVFDIKGKKVTLAKNGGLTPTGWKQLQAAMEIYRNKKFETFRYILIDRKTGEIAEQLAITSHMPNFCSVSKPNDETLKQVITRAEEKDYLIAVCHNHPSGNTTESSFDRDVTNSLDRSLRNSDGLNRFAGHIILDHNTFNLAVPSEKTPGKCHWKKMDVLNVTEIDHLKEPLSKNPDFKLDDYNIISTSVLISVAQQINDTDNWNDNFVPVVFTNADRGISGVQYYSKNFFENDSDKIRNEFQLAAKEAGAIGAFPVITDNLWNKIPVENRSDFEARMKTHVMNDAFTDIAIDKTTITEKYGIEAGRNYYSLQHEQKDRQVDVDSTWEPSVNSLLFPPEGVGEVDKSNDYKTSPKIKELCLKESKVNIFKDSFIQKEKFVPAIFKNNDKDYIIRVSGNDLINEKYNSINTIDIHMNKNQLQNVLKFHLNNEWNRILDNPASEIKLKIRNPKTLSSNQKELFISKGITDEIKMQKLYADIHKEILFDEDNPIVVSKRNFVKQKQIERQNEIQNNKNEFDTDFGY